MNLHTDIPSRAQIELLLASRHPASVSIYVPTDPASPGEAERIALRNLATGAARQLRDGDPARGDVEAIEEQLEDLDEDEAFWRLQARSLAVFATPDTLTTFRLPNALVEFVEVSDRFHLKPLLRSIAFPQVAFVLALAQGSVRLLEVGPELEPSEIRVEDLPSDVAGAVGKASIADRSPSGRIQGSEGQKVRMRQYARQIDQALRPVLAAHDVPLVLACTEPLESIYRSVSSYPKLAAEGIAGSPETTSNTDLAAKARGVLDALHAAELGRVRDLFAQRSGQGRAATDIADVARAATFGMVDTVLVDIDEVVPGTIDEESGAVTFEDGDDAVSYGIVDEIARRVWLTGGRVLAVRRADIPGETSVAAILRYAV
ncbi:MAG TPA: hypothetical protein VMN35_01380 [Gaiellaceae bacterium]|nr:hypothetical protein [Gaiellaceae bacterium]